MKPVFYKDQIVIFVGHKDIITGPLGSVSSGNAVVVRDCGFTCKGSECDDCSGQALSLYNIDKPERAPHWCSRSFRKVGKRDESVIRKLVADD